MENVKVNKSEALDILRLNRSTHRTIFLEAVEGYKAQALKLLEDCLSSFRAGKFQPLDIRLPLPQDQTKDYDRAIRMLEMSVDDVIELDEHSFTCYIMDDWNWKRQFLAGNSSYSVTATSMLGQ